MLTVHKLPYAQSNGYIGNQSPKNIFGAGTIRFGIDGPPMEKVCNYFGRHFKFDATTDQGKNMLSILLSAEMANRKIDVWFQHSSTPGTDNTSGCTQNTMATLTAIGLKYE